jgi:hypothetical protein
VKNNEGIVKLWSQVIGILLPGMESIELIALAIATAQIHPWKSPIMARQWDVVDYFRLINPSFQLI